MNKDKDLPFEIYKDGELVAQFENKFLQGQWLEHYRTTYPKSKITTTESEKAI